MACLHERACALSKVAPYVADDSIQACPAFTSAPSVNRSLLKDAADLRPDRHLK